MARWRGSAQLLTLAVEATTDVVERTQQSVTRRATRPLLLVPLTAPTTAVVDAAIQTTSTAVYQTIRTVNRGVEQALNLGAAPTQGEMVPDLAAASPLPAPRALSTVDHAEAVLNGLFGDTLHARGNELALSMTVRHQGRALALTPAALRAAYPHGTQRLVLFVHGLGCTEAIWCIGAAGFYGDPQQSLGTHLAQTHGFTPLYLRYNSGRALAENGQLLSALLDQLVATYPAGVDELMLVGHSMGGLVAHHAVHAAYQSGTSWLPRLQHLVCIGSPHCGAPAAQATTWLAHVLGKVDSAGTQVVSTLLNARSAGIHDLAAGTPTQLAHPSHVRYGFVAARYADFTSGALSALLGDLVVPLDSAHAGCRHAPHDGSTTWTQTLPGVDHFYLANHPELHALLASTLQCTVR